MNDELRKSLDDVMEEIESIEKWISKNSMDRNTKYLIKYAVIRSCSVIETVFKKLIFNVMSDECNELVKNYLQKKIVGSSTNPKTGNIEKVLQEINSSWKKEFQDYLAENTEKKGDLNSLVTLRNDFAHGTDSSSATIGNIKKYFKSGIDILDKLENILK